MPFLIVNADGDEIPNPKAIAEFQPGKTWHDKVIAQPMVFEMDMWHYNCNWKNKQTWLKGAILPGGPTLEGTYSLQDHRADPVAKRAPRLPNGGWHLSFFLSVDEMIRKLESFAHQEFNRPQYKSREHLMDCIQNGKDLFFRTWSSTQLIPHQDQIATTLPVELQEFHQEMMKHQGVV